MAYYASRQEMRMSTRNIVLTDEQDAFVQGLVASGRYQNASEALRAGLRLLEQEEGQTLDLRERLRTGLAQAREGERAPGSGADAVRRAFSRARRRANL
jgi:antitoxin ParD1/3/4